MTVVCVVLMFISSGSYDGTVRLSCKKWDQVQQIQSSTFFLEENVFLIQVACVSLQCAITDALLFPSLSPLSSLPPTGSPFLPDLLLCGDEGVVQRWGEEGRGRGGWVKKWGAEVMIILILRRGKAISRKE